MSSSNKVPLQRKNSAEIINKMMESILDEGLMKRYGTSVALNMGKEYQTYLDEKYSKLKSEFDKINKDYDDGIDIDELADFLNNYEDETGKHFEKDYVTKLFNIMDKDNSKKISVQEFVTTYIILEEKIRVKQICQGKAIEDLGKLLEKYNKHIMDSKNEVLNENGVANNSSLNIKIFEARNLKKSNFIGKTDPYVVISLGDLKEKSSYKRDTLEPIWNETFVLKVNTLQTELKIEIFDKQSDISDSSLGAVIIPLISLKNQEKREEWFNLSHGDSSDEIPQIRMQIHLVWSRHQYFIDQYNRFDDKISVIRKDIDELHNIMELFEKPFGILLYIEIDEKLADKMWGENEDYLLRPAEARRSHSPRHTNTNFARSMELAVDSALRRVPVEWNNLIKSTMYFIIILSCFSMFARSDFVNLSVGVSIWLIFIKEAKFDVTEEMKSFFKFLFIIALYDILWLYFNFSGFWYSDFNKIARKFAVISSVFNFIAKLILFAGLYMQMKRAQIAEERKARKSAINKPGIKSN